MSLITISCAQRKEQVDVNKRNESIHVLDSPDVTHVEKRDFSKSEISDPSFDKELLFGVWGASLEDPACEFEINEKRLLLCDYDGDGERIYLITGDSIFLNNPMLVFKGKILKITRDSLVIHWQENEEAQVLLRWKTEN